MSDIKIIKNDKTLVNMLRVQLREALERNAEMGKIIEDLREHLDFWQNPNNIHWTKNEIEQQDRIDRAKDMQEELKR